MASAHLARGVFAAVASAGGRRGAASTASPFVGSSTTAILAAARAYSSSSKPPSPEHALKEANKDGHKPEQPAETAAGQDAAAEPSRAETMGQAARRSTAAFDIDTSLSIASLPDPESDGKGRTGAKAKPRSGASTTTQERRSKTNTRILLGLMAIGGGAVAANLGRDWDSEAEAQRFKDAPGSDNFFGRLQLRVKAMWDDFNAPVWEKLLPEPLPYPYQRPYTLILDLDDLLVHSEWSRQHAWRTAKRPGLDYFLGYLSQWYEIVVFTTKPFYIAGPIIEKLDPDRRYIAYTLFRESCRTLPDGQIVKDLNALNRDLSKVIVMDTDPNHFKLHPENGIVMDKWTGQPRDTGLVEMIPFLEAIGIYNVPDVRRTIKNYEGKHIPTQHAEWTRQIQEAEEAEWQRKHSRSGGLKSLVGGLSGSVASATPPKTFYQQERERAQAIYLEDQKYWKENGEALRKQLKDEQEKQIKAEQERQLSEMKKSTWGFLTGKGGNDGAQPQQQAQA